MQIEHISAKEKRVLVSDSTFPLGSAYINFFETDSGALAINDVSYPIEHKMIGARIVVEIVENGYILKGEKKKLICSNEYEMRDTIEKLSIETKEEFESFKKEQWDNLDIANIIIEINAKHKEETI